MPRLTTLGPELPWVAPDAQASPDNISALPQVMRRPGAVGGGLQDNPPMTDEAAPHQRRVRYAGTHPRSFAEKYKGLTRSATPGRLTG